MFYVKDDCFILSLPLCLPVAFPGTNLSNTIFTEDGAYMGLRLKSFFFWRYRKLDLGKTSLNLRGEDVKCAQLCFLGIKNYCRSYD